MQGAADLEIYVDVHCDPMVPLRSMVLLLFHVGHGLQGRESGEERESQ